MTEPWPNWRVLRWILADPDRAKQFLPDGVVRRAGAVDARQSDRPQRQAKQWRQGRPRTPTPASIVRAITERRAARRRGNGHKKS